MNKSLKHLTVEAVKAIHGEVLAAHGGAAGIRDETLLESAVAAPQASMMGQPLISDPIEIAAAYLFYICKNHAFVDGNKRTGAAVNKQLHQWPDLFLPFRIDGNQFFPFLFFVFDAGSVFGDHIER